MQTNPVHTFINERGGRRKVGQALNVKPATVGMWITRRKIPRTAWPEIVEKLDASLDELKATEAAA